MVSAPTISSRRRVKTPQITLANVMSNYGWTELETLLLDWCGVYNGLDRVCQADTGVPFTNFIIKLRKNISPVSTTCSESRQRSKTSHVFFSPVRGMVIAPLPSPRLKDECINHVQVAHLQGLRCVVASNAAAIK